MHVSLITWLTTIGLAGWSPQALAHAAERGFVLAMPTTYYLLGGTLAVAGSFLLFALIKTAAADALDTPSPTPTGATTEAIATARHTSTAYQISSTVSFLLLSALLLAGMFGSHDPLANPLPLSVWTIFWIVFVLLHAVLGNLWSRINPWHAPLLLIHCLLGTSAGKALFRLPRAIGYLPAIAGFLVFAWVELVSLAPEDPPGLARLVLAYWVFNLVAMLLFGEQEWVARGEPFSVLLRFISWLAPLQWHKAQSSRRLIWPGQQLLQLPALSISASFFVLATLATVSFDGLNKTFWWLARHGINPLEFAGRSSVTLINSMGLLQAITLLAGLYFVCIALGWWIEGRSVSFRQLSGRLILAIVPISLAYHFSHYLTQLLVNGQYSVAAFSDPFDQGWNLLGLQHFHVTTSFLSNAESVKWIYRVQVGSIVCGHIFSVALAHLIALRLYSVTHSPLSTPRRSALLSQIPLATLMIAYTLFGLWLLSTATGA